MPTSPIPSSSANPASNPSTSSQSSATLLRDLNAKYMHLHFEKENAFWQDKMDLAGKIAGAFEKNENALQAFITDVKFLPELREQLLRTDINPEEKIGLKGWLRFFEVNAMENPEAKILASKLVEMEQRLQEKRQAMRLGYHDPDSGNFIAASSVKLGLMIRTAKEEALRKAAHAGLRSIENEVLDQGFLDIVKERNRLGRLLGYEDYYDYKVSRNEGFSKKVLFDILGDLEKSTREVCKNSIDALVAQRGASAREGWNFIYYTAGDVTAQMDPYFGFESALGRWGRSFTALGIRYRGATLTLDLLDRKGKYENGFMHGPIPGYVESNQYRPARINFTANAILGQVGSGHRATETLFHEGGHAAHFSNILMPAPCFAQEYAPTSVAFAETQSMFLDSFIETPAWLVQYARNAKGEAMPKELIRDNITKKHPYKAFGLRAMLTVCFAEKAIYEMSDADLTPENVLRTLREIESELQFLNNATRPVLSVPHLLSGESSAYYHGYVLAEMAVHQTRRFFQKRDGALIDNPNIGRDLAEQYWKPGNSKTFLEMIKDLTGESFGAAATVEMVAKPLDAALAEVDMAFKGSEDSSKGSQGEKKSERNVDLDAIIRVAHGDEIIGSTENGQSFASLEKAFSNWIQAKT